MYTKRLLGQVYTNRTRQLLRQYLSMASLTGVALVIHTCKFKLIYFKGRNSSRGLKSSTGIFI